ncbi:DUF6506 family protein [Pararhizobium sp. PWRC1-1]|uniref:DUF6506 family protein n=1 Tax=Pararhizobium sp. PWRC1-1 TaxID=2804566 RepID=UPI003CEE26B7
MKKAIIYEAAGADPARDRIERAGLTIVAIGRVDELVDIASGLALEGVELIELCGGISPRWRPIVQAAVGPNIRVSSVTFGMESLTPAARYSAAYDNGVPPPGAFIFLEPNADPQKDRFNQDFPALRMTFVAVAAEAAAAAIARTLVDDGIGLIELYGGFTSAGAAVVIDAVEGRAPVGIGSFTLEATIPRTSTSIWNRVSAPRRAQIGKNK